MTDTLPSGTTFASANGCTGSGPVVCTGASLDANSTISYTIVLTVNADTTGSITNVVTVSGVTSDSVTSNNIFTSTLSVSLPVTDTTAYLPAIIKNGG